MNRFGVQTNRNCQISIGDSSRFEAAQCAASDPNDELTPEQADSLNSPTGASGGNWTMFEPGRTPCHPA